METAISRVEHDRRSRSRWFSAPVLAAQPGGDWQGGRVSVLRNRDISRISGKHGTIAYICAHMRCRGSDPVGGKAVRAPIPDTVYTLCIGGGCAADVQIKNQ